MTEAQSLALMLTIDIALAVMAMFALRDIRRETPESAREARETRLLTSATVEAAREILRQVKR
ncbi:MAG: hypothetical protein ACRERD_11770 [Candidatus Binatia bacterium]